MTNRERSQSARLVLSYYRSIVPNDDEPETLASDLICDIFHLLDEVDVSHDRVIERAFVHYSEERVGIE